jgi:hypothetical protein
MPKQNYQAFAGSFLDLWQDQVARAMSDTDFLGAIMENMQQMQSGMFGYDAAQQNHNDTADASQPEPDELDDLQRRLGTAERKIIRLEATIERLKERPAAAKPKAKPKPEPKAKAAPKRRATPKRAVAKPKPVAKPAAKAKAKAKPKTTRKRAIKRT